MQRFLAFLTLLVFSLGIASGAYAQSVPNGTITLGQVWNPIQWNSAWQAKVDVNNGQSNNQTLTNPTLNGVISLQGQATDTQIYCLGVDAANDLALSNGACGSGGGGGGSFTATLSQGFTSSVGTQNTGSQVLANGNTLSGQEWSKLITTSAHTVDYTTAGTTDLGAVLLSDNTGGPVAYTLRNPTTATEGSFSPIFADYNGNGFSLTTVSGQALFEGFAGAGQATATFAPYDQVQCQDAGTYYSCTVAKGGTSLGGIAFGIPAANTVPVATSATAGAFEAVPLAAIAASGVTAGSYTCPSITVAASGQLTAASTGSCSGITWPANLDLIVSNGTNTPAGVAPINNDLLVGLGSQGWQPLATANGALLNTNNSGVPAWSATPLLGVSGTTQGCLGLSSSTTGGVVNLCAPATAATVSFNLPTNNGTSGYALTTDGLGNTSWQPGGSGGGGALAFPAGRLTLQSGAPVQSADQAAAATIYYDSYSGTQAPVYNGTSLVFLPISANEVSLALSTSNIASGSVHDIFAIAVNGNLTLCAGPAWTNTTNRGTGAGTTQLHINNGIGDIYTNQNALSTCYGGTGGATNYGSPTAIPIDQATYLGTFYATAAGQTEMLLKPVAAVGGSAPCMCLYNAYNQVPETAEDRDSNNLYTYKPAVAYTWQNSDASANNKVSYMLGLLGNQITGFQKEQVEQGGANDACYIGISYNGAAPVSIAANLSNSTTLISNTLNTTEQFYPTLGLSTLTAQETNSSTTLSCTYTGSPATPSGGVSLSLQASLLN